MASAPTTAHLVKLCGVKVAAKAAEAPAGGALPLGGAAGSMRMHGLLQRTAAKERQEENPCARQISDRNCRKRRDAYRYKYCTYKYAILTSICTRLVLGSYKCCVTACRYLLPACLRRRSVHCAVDVCTRPTQTALLVIARKITNLALCARTHLPSSLAVPRL